MALPSVFPHLVQGKQLVAAVLYSAHWGCSQPAPKQRGHPGVVHCTFYQKLLFSCWQKDKKTKLEKSYLCPKAIAYLFFSKLTDLSYTEYFYKQILSSTELNKSKFTHCQSCAIACSYSWSICSSAWTWVKASRIHKYYATGMYANFSPKIHAI